jgi:hypothetical protein
MNRPQYFFTTPKGFRDMPFVRPVNPAQDDPAVASILPGQYLWNYVVTLDTDAPFLCRSLFVQGLQQSEIQNLQVQLRDAFGNFLTDGFVPLWLYCWGAGSTSPDGGSGRAKVFESELYCPKGGCLILDFYNPGPA